MRRIELLIMTLVLRQLQYVDSWPDVQIKQYSHHRISKRLDFDSKEGKEDCEVFKNEPLHAIMDRICDSCHEFLPNEKQDIRAACR